MSDNNEKNQQNQGGDNNKVEKRFLNNRRRLIALFKGEKEWISISKKERVANDDLDEVINEILADKKKVAKENFKKKAIELFDQERAFNAFVKKAEAEMKAKILEQKKQFSEQAEALFQEVENIDNLSKEFYQTLKGGVEYKASDDLENEGDNLTEEDEK